MHTRGVSSYSTPLPHLWQQPRMSSGSASSPAPQPTRLQEFLRSCPLVTLCLMLLCVAVFVYENLSSFNAFIGAFAMSPASVLGEAQLYRVISAAFTHLSILHIGMNMLSLAAG